MCLMRKNSETRGRRSTICRKRDRTRLDVGSGSDGIVVALYRQVLVVIALPHFVRWSKKFDVVIVVQEDSYVRGYQTHSNQYRNDQHSQYWF